MNNIFLGTPSQSIIDFIKNNLKNRLSKFKSIVTDSNGILELDDISLSDKIDLYFDHNELKLDSSQSVTSNKIFMIDNANADDVYAFAILNGIMTTENTDVYEIDNVKRDIIFNKANSNNKLYIFNGTLTKN